MNDSQALDPAALDRLREWGGDKLLAQMIRLFLENAEERMGQIREGVRDSDTGLMEKGSHSLKSSAANVGAQAVREYAAQIEEASNRGDAETVGGLLSGLEEAYAHARNELETVRGGLSE